MRSKKKDGRWKMEDGRRKMGSWIFALALKERKKERKKSVTKMKGSVSQSKRKGRNGPNPS